MDYMLKEGKMHMHRNMYAHKRSPLGVSHGCTQLEKKKEGRKAQVKKQSKYRKFVS